MKLLEIDKKEAQRLLRDGCNLNIVVFKGLKPKYFKDVLFKTNPFNQYEYTNIDDIIAGIMCELPDCDYYTLKFYEVWC